MWKAWKEGGRRASDDCLGIGSRWRSNRVPLSPSDRLFLLRRIVLRKIELYV
jgi:hypothetical protein